MKDRTPDGLAGEVFPLDAGRSSITFAVGEDGRLHQLGFGPDAPRAAEVPLALYPLAYPTHGEEPLREPALRVTHADGAVSTRLVVRHVAVTSHARGPALRITLADRVAPLEVTLRLQAWPDDDVLEQWVEVTNRGSAPVTVHELAAAAPAFARVDPYLTHWSGGWAAEWTETTEPLTVGCKTVASAGGVRPSLHCPPIVLLHPDGPAAEEEGTVVAAVLAWGGDSRLDAEVTTHGQLRLLAGHQHRGAERRLDPGQTVDSVRSLWCWSDAGVGPTSRALHRFVRNHVVRDGHRSRARVVNTWEAVFFSLDPEVLRAQIDGAARIGGELFLLDDGWFGNAYQRTDDTQGLGDWEVNETVLPGGLQPIIDHTLAAGLRFGLWVEPEMVNPRSRLYEEHPDWVIGEPGREPRTERHQLVLDLCRPEVAEFVVGTIDRLLARHPDISYLKWDANRDITEAGSTGLAADRQSHLALDRVRATWRVMEAVARRHPDVEMMLCASGGGRSELGTLRWFHEVWTSDNTDPVERVRIQWGASHLLPASTLGAHVTRWGDRPLPFALAVALSGRFGFDLDLRRLSEAELDLCRQASADDDAIRSVVQHGDLFRLHSPIGSDRAALAYRSTAGDRWLVFAFVLPSSGDGRPVPPRLGIPGLGPGTPVLVHELTPGRRCSPTEGSVDTDGLLLDWPAGEAPVASIWEIRPIKS